MSKIPSFKHLQIDKSNSRMVLVVAAASFLIIFSLFSSKTLYNQLLYQNRVVNANQKALNQLKADVSASSKLVGTYSSFVNSNPNLINGSSTGSGGNAGNNAQIVLDALPSQYDYPALTTSIQYLLNTVNLTVDSISGTDEQASIGTAGAAAASTDTSTAPTVAPGSAVGMPIQFSVDGPYANILNLFSTFQSSIRPLQFQTISISGTQSDLTLTATVQSYYQPAKTFRIATETIE